MQRINCLISALALTTLLCSISAAQTAQTNPNAELRIVVGEQQVLFTALRPAQELRLEIFNQAGEAVYDSGLLSLAEFTWNLRDTNGAALPPGLYSYTLSLRQAEAETPRRHLGHFIIEQGNERFWLTAKAAAGVGAEVTGGELTVARTGERTVAGTSTGVRSVADARERLSGREIEGRKLAEENQESLKTPGTINLDGGGTTNRLVKWLDADSLTDSVVTDTGHLTIDSSSNLQAAGTGTLIIQGNANKERVELQSAGVTPGPALQGRGFGGTIAAPSASLLNHDLFIIGGSGHNGSGLVTFNAGTVKIKAEEGWTPMANGAYINFETTPSGSPTSARSERMRITGNGNVGIGTNDPQDLLHVNGRARFTNGVGSGTPLTLVGSGPIEFWRNQSGPGGGPTAAAAVGMAPPGVAATSDMVFSLSPSGGPWRERMRLTNGGNLGIGAPFPVEILDVRDGSGAGGFGAEIQIGTPAASADPKRIYFGDGLFVYIGESGADDRMELNAAAGYNFFGGSATFSGFIFKNGGGFKIDHPLDPANKYLYHSFVESPDMKNIYDGVVTLDENGAAVVALPNWFETVNKEFRYQLTCVGGYAPVYVAEEVRGNRFKIAGGRPGLKVSWQVTGIRHDLGAEKHRIPVEEDKVAPEQGKYLHPELYGEPDNKRIGAIESPKRAAMKKH